MEKDSKYYVLNKCFKVCLQQVAQIKAGNTSEKLINDIRQIIHSMYQEKEVTEKVYNNIMNSIKL